MASCGSWVTGRSASSMSFTATCAATTSPSSCSTTTSPRRRVRCRACLPRPCPPSSQRVLEEEQWPPERAASCSRSCWPTTGVRTRSLWPGRGRSARLGIDSRQGPQAGQLRGRGALQPRVDGVSGIIRADQLSRAATHRSAAPWTSSAARSGSSRIPRTSS